MFATLAMSLETNCNASDIKDKDVNFVFITDKKNELTSLVEYDILALYKVISQPISFCVHTSSSLSRKRKKEKEIQYVYIHFFFSDIRKSRKNLSRI
jgi:hypothetical protein